MNNEMIFNTREMSAQYVIRQLATTLRRPLDLLTRYYGSVLERQLNTRQTLHLLNVQAAFIMTVFADTPAVVHLLCLAWLLAAVKNSRRQLA